jgi:hypothetical protein
VSFLLEGELPQIHHVALGALCVKIGCAALAVTLLSFCLPRGSKEQSLIVWRCLAVLGATALSAAAVLLSGDPQ